MAGGFAGRVFWGLALIALGVVWLLNGLGLTDVGAGQLVRTWWPALLVWWGLAGLLAPQGDRTLAARGAHLILAGLGVALLGKNLGWWAPAVPWTGLVLPALLVLAGLAILLGPAARRGGRTQWALMTGVELGGEPMALDDMGLVALMGGIKVDLSRARVSGDEAHIDITAVMGGVELTVPSHLGLVCHSTAVLGGSEVFGRGAGGLFAQCTEARPVPGAPVVHVRVLALMGGVKIREGVAGSA